MSSRGRILILTREMGGSDVVYSLYLPLRSKKYPLPFLFYFRNNFLSFIFGAVEGTLGQDEGCEIPGYDTTKIGYHKESMPFCFDDRVI